MVYKVLQAKRGGFLLRGADRIERFYPARGKLREVGIYAGDDVELDASNGIAKVLPRRNLLIRPPVANVSYCVIVLASVPKPDFYLCDKMIVHCMKNGIEPVICVNKSDCGAGAIEMFEAARKNYSAAARHIVFTSAADGSGIEVLLNILPENSVTVFAGQSAVGKSSLVNRILPSINAEVGELSEKIGRGKNTTRACRLFANDKGQMTNDKCSYLVDTPGFSELTAGDIFYEELKYFYPEFTAYADDCSMRGCNHISEPGCAVIRAAENGAISMERLERYYDIFNELEDFHRNKYK